MATKTPSRPQRPARTIVAENPAIAEMQAHDAAVESLPKVAEKEIVGVVESDGVSILLPVGELPTDGHVRRFNHLDVRLTDKSHIEAFQKLFYALNQSHTLLACQKHVDTPADVIRYLIERYSLATAGS